MKSTHTQAAPIKEVPRKKESKESKEEKKKEKKEPIKSWLFVQDIGAGTGGVIHLNKWLKCKREGELFHYSYMEEFKRKKQAEKYMEKVEDESLCYAVFKNTGEGLWFISPENELSGNWRGSMYGFSTYIDDFSTRKEAENFVKEQCEGTDFTFCENNFYLC